MAEEACDPPKKPPSEYRQWLISAEHKSQDDFDKAVLALSGGALGISFVFVRDIIGSGAIHNSGWLLAAWLLWALSSLAILASFFASHLALRRAVQQCDDGSIYSQTPGGMFAWTTRSLNALGAIVFVTGVCFMALFVHSNLSSRDAENVGQEEAQLTPQQAQQATGATTSNPETPSKQHAE